MHITGVGTDPSGVPISRWLLRRVRFIEELTCPVLIETRAPRLHVVKNQELVVNVRPLGNTCTIQVDISVRISAK